MVFIFFFKDPAPPEISPLPLHDALPICIRVIATGGPAGAIVPHCREIQEFDPDLTLKGLLALYEMNSRSEEHTSELQSRQYLVCRLLLEKNTHHARPNITIDRTTNAVGT